jgi:hypothetical protein
MKFFSFSFLISFVLLAFTNAPAQSVWTVDAVKTNEGQQANYLRFIEANWAIARQKLKDQGHIKSFRVLSVEPVVSQPWDVLLMTEYRDNVSYQKREELFAEVFKTQKLVLIDGKTARDFGNFVSVDSGYGAFLSSDLTIGDVRLPLDDYLKGHATGVGSVFERAFLPEARLLFVREGKLAQRTSGEYAKGATGKPADDESKRSRGVEFAEVAGNAAIAKIFLDYPNSYIVDYFALLKVGGEWKIVNKSFHFGPKRDPNVPMTPVSDAEKKLVGVPIENYFAAQATGNGDLIRKAMDPEAKVMFVSDGKFTQWSAEEFAARFNGKPAADEARRKRSYEILDVFGNAAIVRVTLDYPSVKFTDYMTLLKIGGEWKIINKTFHADQKPARK